MSDLSIHKNEHLGLVKNNLPEEIAELFATIFPRNNIAISTVDATLGYPGHGMTNTLFPSCFSHVLQSCSLRRRKDLE